MGLSNEAVIKAGAEGIPPWLVQENLLNKHTHLHSQNMMVLSQRQLSFSVYSHRRKGGMSREIYLNQKHMRKVFQGREIVPGSKGMLSN